MNSPKTRSQAARPLHVLLIGNNPIDMSSTLEKIKQLQGQIIQTEVAFDTPSIQERLQRFTPDYVLIDDNIGRPELRESIDVLSRFRKTRNTPITILKNSNYTEASASTSVIDYVLKQQFSPESFYRTIKNTLKFRRAQVLLARAYQKQKSQFKLSF